MIPDIGSKYMWLAFNGQAGSDQAVESGQLRCFAQNLGIDQVCYGFHSNFFGIPSQYQYFMSYFVTIRINSIYNCNINVILITNT